MAVPHVDTFKNQLYCFKDSFLHLFLIHTQCAQGLYLALLCRTMPGGAQNLNQSPYSHMPYQCLKLCVLSLVPIYSEKKSELETYNSFVTG